MDRIICIAGPTASGKTALAVELAKELNGEVVSCDSMQVYRRMDIGTAKPSMEERQGIVHHMLDVAEPDENFSVSCYCEMATPIVDDILARGKVAIIAGGTGLYMDSLIKGNDFATGKRNNGNSFGYGNLSHTKKICIGFNVFIMPLFCTIFCI